MWVVTSIRTLLQPFWLRAIVAACPLAVALTVVFVMIGDRGYWRWELGLSGAAVLLAGLMGAGLTQPEHRAYTEAMDELPAEERSAAVIAIWRGPVPEDVRVRAAAIRVGTVYLSKSRRKNHVAIGFLVLLHCMRSATTHAYGALACAVCAVVAIVASIRYTSGRIERRMELLSGGADLARDSIADREANPEHPGAVGNWHEW